MTATVGAPGETVERLAAAGATGALRGAGGTVYLVEGRVVHVESGLATGLATVLTACGRVSPATWLQTVRAYGPEHRVGRMLVERGHLTRGELELCHLDALYDAAFFTLTARTTTGVFEPGVRHWLGPVNLVGARALRRETVRRRDLLERIWPWPQVDTSPVRPGLADPRARQRLGPRRCRLLELADGRRTPADIARLLGRSAFATTVEIRRLAASGLVETPAPEPLRPAPPLTRPPRPVPQPPGLPSAGLPSRGPWSSEPRAFESAPAAPPPPGEPRRAARAGPGLLRRNPGESLAHPRQPRHAAVHPLSVHDPDVALLTRVLTALEDRL
ncbi:hypothetical protein GCM10009760_13320 [Kitasatospora kazusensis]|uniref:PatA-like N-terminal domain-containing protein n=1 Tax=Kitasatospora kazusensis TaxID=407974 RepID=A0ABP5KSP5_9ACTN